MDATTALLNPSPAPPQIRPSTAISSWILVDLRFDYPGIAGENETNVPTFFRPFPTSASPSSTSSNYNPQWLPLTYQLTPSGAAPAQRSVEWFALRKDRLPTSTFSTALGLWKGKRRSELWQEKVFPSETETRIPLSSKHAMEYALLLYASDSVCSRAYLKKWNIFW